MDSITCPCCQLTSYNPNDAKHCFCGRCHWWTSDPELAPYHFALPCEYRGQGVTVPRLGAWHREARVIRLPDHEPWISSNPGVQIEAPTSPRAPFEFRPMLPIEITGPWLHTRPGTMLELSGTMRRRPLPWWRHYHWKRHLRAIRRLIGKLFNGNL